MATVPSKLLRRQSSFLAQASAVPNAMGISKYRKTHVQLFRALQISAYTLAGCLYYYYTESGWSGVDCFYFVMTTMSTVGYGDFSPSPYNRIFTIFFIFVGIGAIFPALALLLSIVVDPITEKGRAILEKLSPQHRIDIDGDGECDYVVPRPPLVYYSKNLLPSILLNLVVQLLSAAMFVMLEPGWTFGDALYHCVITATTVGYGDMSITTQGGRLWAGFQIFISVVLVGEFITTIGDLQKAREEQLKKAAQLANRLDEQLVPRLMERVTELRPPHARVSASEEGLNELEFVLANLIELQIVSVSDIQPFVKSFREMDADSSGRLNKADVAAMREKAMEKQAVKRPTAGVQFSRRVAPSGTIHSPTRSRVALEEEPAAAGLVMPTRRAPQLQNELPPEHDATPTPKGHLVADAVFRQLAGPTANAVDLSVVTDYLVGRGDIKLEVVQDIVSKLDANSDGSVNKDEWRAGFSAGLLPRS